ncbi:unnamed protein product [Dovyalis caffra]|uniref:GDSL esterase/lipase n=1 Tax=Dovyalis caffra TaxID=77055 RepID=A0AAV1QYU7_9ROSI|nr:unnamed protein product [Dovyalis caffra]
MLTGLFEVLCRPTTPTYGNLLAAKFIFWDALHPSTSAYRVMAQYIEKEALCTSHSPLLPCLRTSMPTVKKNHETN